MKKRILLVTFSDNSDHQDATFGMYEELKKRNEDVYLIAIRKTKVSINIDTHVKLVNCPNRPGITVKTFNIVELFRILKWIYNKCFDVIYFESLHLWNVPIMMIKRKKTKIFHTIHDVIPHEGDKQAKMVNLMNRVVVKFSDIIILRNRKYINVMSTNYKIDKDKIKCIELWRRFPDYKYTSRNNVFLFFGRLNVYKGVNNLIEIVNACQNIDFNIVGKLDSQIEFIANKLKQEKNVYLKTGYVTEIEMEEAFLNCDWVILPYNSATQSGVIVDAYRFGKPVIAYNVGAISEQIEDGKTGFLIEANNNNKFIEIIRHVTNMNEEKYMQFCRDSYEYGKKKYGVENAVNIFMKLIDNVENR